MAVKNEIMDLFDLTGKVAIITGGGKGIGEGISARLAQAGAKVVICDINKEVMEKTICKFSDMGLDVTGVYADISSEVDCANLVNKACETYGGLDILVNNAAYYPTIPLVETKQEDWDKVYAVNCRGAFLLAREAAKIFVSQNREDPGRGGSIIFISSIGALRTNRGGMSAYHSSKGAVLSLKNELAAELAPYSIRVNCVLPGAINTAKYDEIGCYIPYDMPINKIPLGRIGVPDDIANAALYLASPAAQYVTGVDITVDGGLYKLPAFGYPEEQKTSRINA